MKQLGLAIAGLLLILVGALLGAFIMQSVGERGLFASAESDLPLFEPWSSPTFEVVMLATPTATPSATPDPLILATQAALATSAQGDAATPTPDLPATPTPEPVQFRVAAEEVLLQKGPGTAYPAVARAGRDALLLLTGRTADGLWWQVCCMEGEVLWLQLDQRTVLHSGDIGSVAVLDVLVYDLPPTPEPPPPPAAVSGQRAAQAPPPAPPTIAPTPTVTPRPAGNPACAVAGARYGTIPVLGAPRQLYVENDPEINLTLRGYAAVDGFLQQVGIGGDTDPHALKLPTLFDEWREIKDFASVYRVHEWNWNCNCRGPLTHHPEITLLGIPTHPGETLRVPDRSNGDIGEGYRVMVLYATPNSIVLKYTREDDMVGGYGLHIEGICVDPNLLALYYEMDDAGRRALPALNGRQPIGHASGGVVRVAIRDSGQFMDPRSKKDWWDP